ncbi:MAG: hypothetical protein HOP33_12015 [Verrucomicrobia bacterium]|nr:hypothetical protein [Verrucomicrobiota bacterium]
MNPVATSTVAWFEWDVTAAAIFRQRTTPQSIGSGNTAVVLSATLTNLLPGIGYHYRVVASNSLGLVSSRDVFFRGMTIALAGANPLNAACGEFVDPGALPNALPTRVVGGSQYCIAQKADGSLVGWGRNHSGVLNCPVLANVVGLSSASLHNLAVLANGSVAAWGDSAYGKTTVPALASGCVAVAAGGDFSIALRSDGRVVGWGDNTWGQRQVPAAAQSGVVAISAGAWHSLALKTNGTVVAWGAGTTIGAYHEYGQSIVPPEATNVVAVAAGAQNSMVLRADGSVLVWGQSCCGITTVPPEATNIVGIALAVNSTYCLALRTDGKLIGWGDSSFGQTGTPAEATNVVAIAAGGLHTIVTRADGSIFGWGDSSFGQLPPPADLASNTLPVSSSSTMPPSMSGTYEITYSVTGADGANATTNRVVQVTNLPPSSPLTLRVDSTNNTLRLVFTNSPCVTFTVLGSTNLSIPAGDWPVLGPAVEISPGQYEFSSVFSRPEYYYRVVLPAF